MTGGWGGQSGHGGRGVTQTPPPRPVGAAWGTRISVAKNPTTCRSECSSCEYRLRWRHILGHDPREGGC
eukprot:1036235-Pyramimonas_sp.AAC.2